MGNLLLSNVEKTLVLSYFKSNIKVIAIKTALLFNALCLNAQEKPSKPLINDTTYLSWTAVDNGTLSNDGKFAYYRIKNEPLGGNTWVILATDKSWEVRSVEYSNLNFSNDNQYLYAMQRDSLIKLKLKTSEVIYIPRCKGYELYSKGKFDWVIYTLDDAFNSLVIQNIKTKKQTSLTNIQEYSLNKKGATIITKLKPVSAEVETMQETNLITGQSKIIYEGTVSRNQIFDNSGNRLAFETTNKGQTQIWYFERNWNRAQIIASDTSKGIAENLKITTDETWRFSADGQDLFFNLAKKKSLENKKSEGAIIWNYQDLYLQSEYEMTDKASSDRGDNLSVFNIKKRKLLQLLFGNQNLRSGSFESDNNYVLIVESSKGPLEEISWNKGTHLSYSLCFVKTGKIIPIAASFVIPPAAMELSPNNDYLVYFDYDLSRYLSYEIKSGKTEIISGTLKDELAILPRVTRPGVAIFEGTAGIVGWVDGTKKVVVKGKYDLWELDLSNQDVPKNLTQGIGAKENIVFSYFNVNNSRIINPKVKLTLFGFNMRTKHSSVYVLNKINGNLKEQHTSSGYLINPYEQLTNVKKASRSNSYLLYTGNVETAANYVFTIDFLKFDTLSNIHPERKYNWLSSQLGTYKDKIGNVFQGILYRPDNFDSTKKYPVIFNYYLESSSHLHEPLNPKPASAGFNIPILVSNGYLVFMPDIYYQQRGQPGESALTGVLAAADYLGHLNWVDTTKMGIIGHSYGGFETNYIVTHSNRFKAAVSSAGISNLIEYYNSWNDEGGNSNQFFTKNIFWIMGDGLENIPSEYISNSPIMDAKNIYTPLLLMHNEGDRAVPVTQSTSFFVQLRSLRKPVWLLQYKGEGHILYKKLENKLDYQNKIKDFFDYYLKDKSIPIWMNSPIK
ncbi:MAG: prolyl oligopeptidase family serine peptidase [Bacteroidota bacterium]